MYLKIFIIIISVFLFFSKATCEEPVLIRENTYFFWNQNSAALDDGVVYCWTDTKDSKWNVYAQKVDAEGNKLWNNGNPLLIDNRNDLIKYFSKIISTSDNCVIIVWQNIKNNNWQDNKVYAQKISSSGETLWQQNTELIVENFCVVPNNIGGAYIFHLFSGDIYGINLDSNANDLWETNNLPIVENAYLLSTISDNTGGSILSYKDCDNENLKVIRINFEKEILWNQMIYSTFPSNLNSISVGNNNFIFCWKIGQNIYGQRVDINGNIHWEDNGIVIIDENISFYSKVDFSSNDDCFFVMYSTDENEEDSFSLKAQKINLEGSPEWNDSVILEEENTSFYFSIDSHIDDNGGCYFSWLSNSNIISQCLDSDGNKLWEEEGIELGIGFNEVWPQNCLKINKIGNNVFFSWQLFKEGRSFLSYQCLDQDGTFQLPENGVDIREGLLGYIYNYQTVSNDNSSYHIWEDGRYPYFGRIFVQRVSSEGAIYFEDNGLALTDTSFSSQGYVTAKPLPENGIIAAWTEQKQNEEFKRVRWQKVNENGNTFSENGVDLTVDIEYEQKNPKIEINDGNIIIAWLENEQIKAQKLVNDEPVWGNNGKVIVENCSIYYFSMIGNYFYWGLDDNRYFIMIDENGNIPVNWPVSGIPLPDFITYLFSMDVIEENLLFSYKSYQNGQRDYGIQILSSNAEYLFNGCGLTLYSDDSLNNLNVFFDGYINFV